MHWKTHYICPGQMWTIRSIIFLQRILLVIRTLIFRPGSNPVRLTTKINDLAEIIHKPVKPWVPNGFQNRAPHVQRARPCATCAFLCERGLLHWVPVAWLNAIHTIALTFSEIPASQHYPTKEMTKSPLSGVGGRYRLWVFCILTTIADPIRS